MKPKQMSAELFDMLEQMRASGFKVSFHSNDPQGRLGIDIEDREGTPLRYLASLDDDEAAVFVDFTSQVVDTFGWDDDDLFEAQMRQEFRAARAELRASAAWDQVAVNRVHAVAVKEMEAFKERGEYDERLILTPEAAEDLLLRHHKVRRRRGLPDPDKPSNTIDFNEALSDEDFTNQRRQSKAHADEIERIISEGRIMLTHQGAAVDPHGFIFDGLHRITAIASGIFDVAIKITWNANPLTMPVIDTGKPRKASDVYSMYGIANATAIAAIVRILYNVDHYPDNFARWADKLDPQQAIQEFSRNYRGVIESYKAATHATTKNANKLSPTALAAAHFAITRAWPDAPIEPFMHSIRGPFPDPFYNSRYNTDPKREQHPALKLVDWAFNDVEGKTRREKRTGAMSARGNSHFIMVLRAWNASTLGKTIGAYSWNDLTAVPEIFGM